MHRFIVAASLSALLVGASVVSAAPVTVQGLSPLPRSLPERCTKVACGQSGAEDAIAAILELGHEHPALAQRDPMIAGVMDRTATMNRTPQMARLSGR